MKNPHAVALGRQGGLARRGKPGRKLSSEEARRIRAIRTQQQIQNQPHVKKAYQEMREAKD